VLPFQVIEQMDEPRAEKPGDTALQSSLFDSRGRRLKGCLPHFLSLSFDGAMALFH
jgi:hypothetical protein